MGLSCLVIDFMLKTGNESASSLFPEVIEGGDIMRGSKKSSVLLVAMGLYLHYFWQLVVKTLPRKAKVAKTLIKIQVTKNRWK